MSRIFYRAQLNSESKDLRGTSRNGLMDSLKACARWKDANKGHRIHAYLMKAGFLGNDIYLDNALINMYAKCGLLGKAEDVFQKLVARDVISWNALISGYVEYGHGEKAVRCFELMQREGFTPSVVTFLCVLKACGSIGLDVKGLEIHDKIIRMGLLKEQNLGNALIDMYSKCSVLKKAQEVFDKLPVRDVVSWNALIDGYAQHGHGEKAITLFEWMKYEGVKPNTITYLCVLKACGRAGGAINVQTIHDSVGRDCLLEELNVVNSLLDAYAKCGLIGKAKEVFDNLSLPDVVTWTSLIAGYEQHGMYEEALQCFEQMQMTGCSPNRVTFSHILKVCGSMGSVSKGREIHAKLAKEGLFETNTVIGNVFIDMYSRCGVVQRAREVFDELPFLDVVSWTTLITGYVLNDLGEEALSCFLQMQQAGFSPNTVTFAGAIKACTSIEAINSGQEIHAMTVSAGLIRQSNLIGNAMIDFYGKCKLLRKAQETFNDLAVQDAVSWNALIAGYVQHGYVEEAWNCYEAFKQKGFCPNSVTYICMLKACGSIRKSVKCDEIHETVLRDGFLDNDIVVGNALVDMYAKCGFVSKAQKVFDELSNRDVVSWNVLMAGYAQHGYYEEVLECFQKMKDQGFYPDDITFVCILKVCGCLGSIYKGQEIHSEIVKSGLLDQNSIIGSALVDMYASSASVVEAKQVFDGLPSQSRVSWTALIAGYAQLGLDEIVFNTFQEMLNNGENPDLVSLTIVLNTCSHSGLLDEGHLYFQTITEGYDIVPAQDHYTCMVDLHSRAGCLENAYVIIEEMPYFINTIIWHAFLGACLRWTKVQLGKLAFEHAIELDGNDCVSYVCMSNIYAGAVMQEHAEKIEAMNLSMV